MVKPPECNDNYLHVAKRGTRLGSQATPLCFGMAPQVPKEVGILFTMGPTWKGLRVWV
jgi:hypothetical protein